jgi:hypothetical protein
MRIRSLSIGMQTLSRFVVCHSAKMVLLTCKDNEIRGVDPVSCYARHITGYVKVAGKLEEKIYNSHTSVPYAICKLRVDGDRNVDLHSKWDS